LFAAAAHALTLPSGPRCGAAASSLDRRHFLGLSSALAAAAASVVPPARAETTPFGVSYTVLKTSKGGERPVPGDLVAIKFKCAIQKTGAVIDNIMDNPEPYYYRVGSGQVLPAVEKAVVLMRSGDTWQLEVPPELGFGKAGRSASPGKPRISGDTVLDFTLELVAVPGKDEEILEQNGVIN